MKICGLIDNWTIDFLDKEISKCITGNVYKSSKFNEAIVLENICFSYDINSKPILNNLNIRLNKGMKIGLVGAFKLIARSAFFLISFSLLIWRSDQLPQTDIP